MKTENLEIKHKTDLLIRISHKIDELQVQMVISKVVAQILTIYQLCTS